jgi:hypothetical protein
VKSCKYERTLHAARCQDGLPTDVAATIAIAALRYGPHGRLRAAHVRLSREWRDWGLPGWPLGGLACSLL